MVFAIHHQHESTMGTRVSPILHPLPPPSPPYPSGLSQRTDFGCPTLCNKLALVIHFTYGNIHVPMLCLTFVECTKLPKTSSLSSMD